MPFASFTNRANINLDELDFEEPLWKRALGAVAAPVLSLAHFLDTPAGWIRGALAGDDLNEIISDTFEPMERATGADVLKKLFGRRKKEGFDPLALGTEILLDPLIFTGSVTGLTKAGRAGLKLSKAESRLAFKTSKLKQAKAAFPAETDPLKLKELVERTAPNLYDDIASETKFIDKLKGEGVQDLIKGATRTEEIARGQRGLSFSIPFARGEIVPTELNKVLAPINELVGTGRKTLTHPFGPITEKWKKYFSTAAKTEVGQLTIDAENVLNANTRQNLERTRKVIKKEYDELVTLGHATKEEIDKKLAAGIEWFGSPKKIRGNYIKSLDLHRSELDSAIEQSNYQYAQQITTAEGEVAKFEQLVSQYQMPEDVKNLETWQRYTAKLYKDAEKQHKTIITRGQTRLRKMNEIYKKDIKAATDGEGLIGHYPVEFKGRLKQLRDDMMSIGIDPIDVEIATGRNITHLQSNRIGYLPHVATGEWVEFSKTNKKAQEWNAHFKKNREYLIGDTRGQHALERKFKDKTLPEMNELFRKEFDLNFDPFETDPIKLVLTRQAESNKVLGNMRNFTAAIHLGGEATGERHIADLLAEINMTGFTTETGQEISWGLRPLVSGKPQALETWTNRIRTALEEADYDKYISQNLWDDLHRATGFDLGDLESIASIFDTTTVMYRSLLTAHPAHVGTNLMGNLWSNLISGMNPIRSLKHYQAGKQLVRQWVNEHPDSGFKKILNVQPGLIPGDEQLLLDAFTSRGGNRNLVREVTERARPEGAKQEIGKWRATFIGERETVTSRFFKKAFDVNSMVEEVSKYAHFRYKVLEEGMSFDEAMDSVKKYLFDYTDLTPFEKKVMRRGVLFYTFARKNLPLAVQETMVNRKAYALEKFIIGTQRPEDHVPDYLLDQGSIRIGPGQFIDLKMPLFEANRFSPQGGGIERVLHKVMQMAIPPIKVGAEVAGGTEFFRGIPLEEATRLDPGIGGLLNKVGLAEGIETERGTQFRTGKLTAEALRNFPLSRWVQTLRDIGEEEVGVAPSLLGARYRKIAPEKLKYRDIIRNLQEQLSAEPSVKKFKRYYSPAKEPSQKVQDMLDALKEANKQYKTVR